MPRALLLVVLAAPAALAFSTFDGIQYVNTFWEIWEKGEETAFKATYSPGLQFEIPAVGVNITGINNVWTLRQGIEGNGNGDLRTLNFRTLTASTWKSGGSPSACSLCSSASTTESRPVASSSTASGPSTSTPSGSSIRCGST
mmetsp:Transcript_34258/g.83232  ORF Transcript_34258/g.83232 Transcript_34258/m.83232 type:complete len:143 (-) Transcript_34258:1960-2388(-)